MSGRFLLDTNIVIALFAGESDVKSRLDPQWLLGRGTLFPAPAGVTGGHNS